MEESSLWVAVIEQALWDATLGATQIRQSGRRKPYVLPSRQRYFQDSDIVAGRKFITGEDGVLLKICRMLDMDYEVTRELLMRRYRDTQHLLPEEYRECLETFPHNGV